MEHYFELNNLSPAEKIRSSVICSEGEELYLGTILRKVEDILAIGENTNQLIEHFQPTQEGAFHNQLFFL